MSAFSGPQGRGADKIRRTEKKTEAETRNSKTPKERTRAYRREQAK